MGHQLTLVAVFNTCWVVKVWLTFWQVPSEKTKERVRVDSNCWFSTIYHVFRNGTRLDRTRILFRQNTLPIRLRWWRSPLWAKNNSLGYSITGCRNHVKACLEITFRSISTIQERPPPISGPTWKLLDWFRKFGSLIRTVYVSTRFIDKLSDWNECFGLHHEVFRGVFGNCRSVGKTNEALYPASRGQISQLCD